jgi:hypothetical protein
MPPAAKSRSVGESAPLGPRVLDLLMSGRSVDNIADAGIIRGRASREFCAPN